MSFLLLGLAVLFSVHLVASTGLSLLVAAVLPLVEPRLHACGAPRRTRLLFALAMLPSLGGLAVVLGLALPAWLVHEPRGTGEGAGPVLLALAAAGVLLLLVRLGGAARDQLRTLCVVSRWKTRGRDVSTFPLPTTRFAHDFPLAGLVGLFRPRLLLADALFRALAEDEIAAVVAHEQAHADARDNLRQLLLRASPDPLALIPAGARLRTEFAEAAEAAADAQAGTRVAPLALARALLKVASLVPADRRLEVGFASLHREGSLAARVQALVTASDRPAPPAPNEARPRPLLSLAVLAAASGLAASLLPTVHRLLEALVHAGVRS